MRHTRTASAALRAALRKWFVLSTWLFAGVLVVIQACTSENITDVVVTSVTVTPSSTTVRVGETAQFDARVVDENGVALQGAGVAWSVQSNDGDIASIDGNGLLTALGEGTATIRAEFRGASDQATLTIDPAPRIGVTPFSVTLYAGVDGPVPAPAVVQVTNGGAGPLGSLATSVSYPEGEAEGWLVAALAGSSAPTELEISAQSTGMPVGVYPGIVTLTSPDAPDEPNSVPVTLSVTGFTLTETGGATVVSEDGGTDTIRAVLDSEPSSNVVLDVVSGDVGAVTVSPASLTFTPSNWNTPQAITVTGVDDAVPAGDRETLVIVSVDPALSDPAYGPAVDRSVMVTTLDDDEVGFVVTETDGETVVTEDGSTDTLTVVLRTRPSANVVFLVTASDPTEATVSPATLTFTPTNWNQPQNVIVTGVDDDLVDGPQTSTVTIAVDDDNSAAEYRGLPDQSVSVTTLDNDSAGLVLADTTALQVTESGDSARFTVALSSQPASPVVVTLTSMDLTEVTVSPASLTFESDTWDIPQTVTLTGVPDDVVDGNTVTSVVLAVQDGSDPEFTGVRVEVSVTNLDNDAAGIILSGHESLTVTEAGGTDTFSVRLSTEPMSNVVLSVLSEDVGRVTASPTSLTFTPTNWATSQTVTLTGVEDDIVDSVVTQVLIVVRPESSDSAYAQVAALAVDVTTLESYTLSVTKTGSGTVTSSPGGISIAEGGTSDSALFEDGTTVTLTATPADGWQVDSWGGACSASGAGTSCAAEMTSDLAASVTFTEIPPENHTLSVTKTGSGTVTSSPGGISIAEGGTSDSALFEDGTAVTLTATPADGWQVDSWGGACSASGAGTSCAVAMTSDLAASVTFTEIPPENYTLTVTKTGSGTVTSSPGGISIAEGETSDSAPFEDGTTVTLTATPSTGWQVDSWGGACSASGTGPSCAVAMTSDLAASVTFTEIPPENYTLTVTKTGSGTVTSSPGGISIAEGETSDSASFDDGTTVTLTATPSTGWQVDSWGGACSASGTGPSCAVEMTSDLAASVTFTEIPPDYTLTVTKTGSGTVTSSPGGISIAEGETSDSASFDDGTTVTLTATPAPGWQIDSWGGACSVSGTGTSCAVEMTSDLAASVTFTEIPRYALSVTTEGSGTVTSSPGGISIAEGETSDTASFDDGTTVTLTATPSTGWQIGSWGEACSATGTVTSCEVEMTSDLAASVTFTEIPPSYTLTVTKTGRGTVASSPAGISISTGGTNGSATFQEGTTVTLTATPSGSWRVESWGGACSGSGTGTTCAVEMMSDLAASVAFTDDGDVTTDDDEAGFVLKGTDLQETDGSMHGLVSGPVAGLGRGA